MGWQAFFTLYVSITVCDIIDNDIEITHYRSALTTDVILSYTVLNSTHFHFNPIYLLIIHLTCLKTLKGFQVMRIGQ